MVPGPASLSTGELTANPKVLGTTLLALFSLFVFLPATPVSLWMAAIFATDPSSLGRAEIWQVLPVMAGLLITAGAGVVFVSMAVVALWDLRLPRPVIRVDREGVFDRRLAPDPIPWANIERVFMKAAQNSGIELHLRSPLPTPLNRFRLGGLWAWRRRDDGIAYIALNDTVGPTIDREAMAQLAVENGVEAVTHYNRNRNDIRRPFSKP